MKNFIIAISLLLPLLFANNADAKTKEAARKEASHYDVVANYIQSLGAVYNVQKIAGQEFKEDNDNPSQKLLDGIKSATRFKLEIGASIATIKGKTLKKPFDSLIPTTIAFYKEKIKLYDELIDISTNFLDSEPKPGVDYSKLTARVPEISASIDYIDESIFRSMPLVFALLIDEKPDSEGHMSHLNITVEQRQELLDNINSTFGESLEQENKNWTVSSAALLKAYLLKDYKCTDEWQKK